MSKGDALTHEQCSELLLPYVLDELGPQERGRVDAHLASCDECAAELRGLHALLAPAPQGLTDLERRRLEARVEAQVAPAAQRRSPAGERLTRWLGVAALLVLVAVGVATVGDDLFSGTGGGDELGTSVESGDDGSGAGADNAPAVRDIGGPTPVFVDDVKRKASGPAEEEATAETGDLESTVEGVEGNADFDPRAKVFEFVSGRALWRFSESYSGKDAVALQQEFIDRLADQASSERRAQVEDCAEQASESQPFPILPAYGTIDQTSGRPRLVLVFVWSDDDTSALNRYQLWSWPLGNCDAPPDYEAGTIPKR